MEAAVHGDMKIVKITHACMSCYTINKHMQLAVSVFGQGDTDDQATKQ